MYYNNVVFRAIMCILYTASWFVYKVVSSLWFKISRSDFSALVDSVDQLLLNYIFLVLT